MDARPLVVLRILFGLILPFQLIDLWPDATAFYSNVGVLPRQDLDPDSFGVLLFSSTPMQVSTATPWAASRHT